MSHPALAPGGALSDADRALVAAWSPPAPPPARRGTPVVLVFHGTRDSTGRREQKELLARLQAGHDGAVLGGVIEWSGEGLPPVFEALATAAAAARAARCDEVRIVPCLLFPAGHARHDMLVIVRGARRLHPGLRWRCMPLLSPGPLLIGALADRIRNTEAAASLRAEALVVVGRGSSVAVANQRLARTVAAPLHRLDGRPVSIAFGSLASPSLPETLADLHERGVRDVVVAPVLLNAGYFTRLTLRQSAEFVARQAGMRIAVATHLHGHPAVLAHVAARVAGHRAHGAGTGATTVSRGPRGARRPIVVAGTASGIGKTTVALGLMTALRRRGLRVQPFKVGPDYIDPLHHAEICGRPSRNLDSVMCGASAIPALAARALATADVAVVEGVLGLFDGRLGVTDEGSTAEVARLLGAEVILVVDAARSSRSVGAVALGFARFDPSVRLCGVVLNRVGSAQHEATARAAVEAAGLRVLGALPRDHRLGIPERYLGLVPPHEQALPRTWIDAIATAVERHVDLSAVMRAIEFGGGPPVSVDAHLDPFAVPPSPRRARIALAWDSAFSFAYRDALDLLEHRGAELVPFSPLSDAQLPACDAVWLPGGFPERFAVALEANLSMRRSLAAAAASGVPIVAECGGAMYLGTHITTEDGERHDMCGVIPTGAIMGPRRRALGYRTVTAHRDSPLFRAGETVTGHEFHWSAPDRRLAPGTAAWTVAERNGELEGFASRSVLASYVHLHLVGAPAAAARFVAAAASGRSSAPVGRSV